MRRGSYIECHDDEITVQGFCHIIAQNTLYLKMIKPYRLSIPIEIGFDRLILTENEEGMNILFDESKKIMSETYRAIKIIEREPKLFQRLYVNFESMVSGQSIRLDKKVFYSDTEREYFIRETEKKIKESYYQLFDKYILSNDKEVLDLRDKLTPQLLRQIMQQLYFYS